MSRWTPGSEGGVVDSVATILGLLVFLVIALVVFCLLYAVVGVIRAVTVERAQHRRRDAALTARYDRTDRLRRELPPFLHAYCRLFTTVAVSELPEPFCSRFSTIKDDILACMRCIWTDPKVPAPERRVWEKKSVHALLTDFTFTYTNLKDVDGRMLQPLFENMVSGLIKDDGEELAIDTFTGREAAAWVAGAEEASSHFLQKQQLEDIEREQHLIYGYTHTSEYPSPLLTIPQADRFSHAYLIGKTGSGKSTFLKNLIAQQQFPEGSKT